MKAEIFYYTQPQKVIALRTIDFLRNHIYPGISVTLRDVSAETRDAAEIGWRYIKLLQASIPLDKGIKLSLKDISIHGYGFYINIYYPFASRDFQGAERQRFFPALAVHDRMLLVPKALGKLLEYEGRIFAPFLPLETGGVEEVEFHDEEELRGAVKRMAGVLRRELSQEIHAYASYRRFDEITLSQLAQDLGTDEGFLRYLWETEDIERAFYRDLSCELDQYKVPPNRWSRLSLIIHNRSQTDLENAWVEIKGPAKILPSRIRANVASGSTTELPIALMPEGLGDFPLELVFVLPEDRVFADWLPVHHVWIHCE